jgi:hypothetical protein
VASSRTEENFTYCTVDLEDPSALWLKRRLIQDFSPPPLKVFVPKNYSFLGGNYTLLRDKIKYPDFLTHQ